MQFDGLPNEPTDCVAEASMAALSERVLSVPATLDRVSVDALAGAIESAMSDASVGAVVLQGSQEIFCQGLDLDELVGSGSDGQSLHEQSVANYCRCLRALRFSDKPAIAVVEGATLGGGLGLVAATDVVIAGENATFGLPEVLFGLAPAMVLPFLLERVPVHTARIWALSGVARTAADAKAAGLVDVLVSNAALPAEVKRWLKTLRRAQRQGIRTIKQLSATIPALDCAAALELGRQTTLAAMRDPSTIAAVKRYKLDGVLPWEAP